MSLTILGLQILVETYAWRRRRRLLTFLCAAAQDTEDVVMTTNLLHHLHLVYQVIQLSFTRTVYSIQGVPKVNEQTL